MTVEWFDLGQRVYAATHGHVVDRLVHAPIPAPRRPVAVRAHVHNGTVHVAAADPDTPERTATNGDALGLLYSLGVRITAPHWRTLVIDDPATLTVLSDLARNAVHDGLEGDVAAQIGWWLDRADFPGTSAVIDLLRACRARWITGRIPADEQRASTWREWLHIPTDHCDDTLAMLERVTDGPPLPGMDVITKDDAWSWQRARDAHGDGLNWRTPDTRARAALGLRSRCDAAELYDAGLLADPLFRRRAVHTGHVITGVVTEHPTTRRVRVSCDRLDARVREGAALIGWVGPPTAHAEHPFNAMVVATAVQAGRLTLDLTMGPAVNESVTLHAAPPNPAATARARRDYAVLYSARRSWLTTGRDPTVTRRDVPLDILIAAAE